VVYGFVDQNGEYVVERSSSNHLGELLSREGVIGARFRGSDARAQCLEGGYAIKAPHVEIGTRGKERWRVSLYDVKRLLRLGIGTRINASQLRNFLGC
jgi:hypothetical protein